LSTNLTYLNSSSEILSIQRDDIQLVIFPGIGEDHRMSYAQQKLSFKVIGVDYIAPVAGDSMASYARRLGQHLIASGSIDSSKPLFLAGVSFGGVIAQELSNRIRCDGVILISTYRHRDELAKVLRYLGTRVAPRLPLGFYQFFRSLTPIAIRMIARLKPNDVMLCARMYGDFPKKWFRQHCQMAASWRGCEVNVPRLRIHGEVDPVIPHYWRADINVLISQDKHMCSLSNRERVNGAITNFIRQVMSARGSG
jgi:pimeloyl-ACP methyl ester carboxylesterase